MHNMNTWEWSAGLLPDVTIKGKLPEELVGSQLADKVIVFFSGIQKALRKYIMESQ